MLRKQTHQQMNTHTHTHRIKTQKCDNNHLSRGVPESMSWSLAGIFSFLTVSVETMI